LSIDEFPADKVSAMFYNQLKVKNNMDRKLNKIMLTSTLYPH